MTAPNDSDQIESDQWQDALARAHESGFTFFDFLTAVDRENSTDISDLELIVRVARPDLGESLMLSTRLSGGVPTVASVTSIYPGADWHERETAEMFGIDFIGNNVQPLLRHQLLGGPPLRKSVVLSTRVVTEWPGAAEPEIQSDGRKVGNPSRRRQRPPGVPENWIKP